MVIIKRSNTMKKRIFSIILSIIVICSLSINAFAASNIIDEGIDSKGRHYTVCSAKGTGINPSFLNTTIPFDNTTISAYDVKYFYNTNGTYFSFPIGTSVVFSFYTNIKLNTNKVTVGIVDDAGLEFDQDLKSGTYIEGFGYYYYFNFTLYKSSNWCPFITNNMGSSISVTSITMNYN